MNDIIEIGPPGKFDPVFSIKASINVPDFGMEVTIYYIVWKDTGNRVEGTMGYFNPIQAERYVKYNRKRLIDDYFEEIALFNE